MPRILGVDIPADKRIDIALRYIYGIGPVNALEILDDGWTVVTRDRQVSAHFEHTVLITDSGPEILTRDEESQLY